MKRKFTLLALLTAFVFSGMFAQETRQLVPQSNEYLAPFLNTKANNSANFSIAKQVEATSFAISGYTAGETQDIFFSITLVNADEEYGDSLSLTFPAGFTINSVSNDDVFGPATGANPTADFNGIDGQVVSWGDNNNDFGGIETGREFVFSVNVTVEASTTGEQDVALHVNGDAFGPSPGDFDGTISIPDGQTIAGIVINSPEHTTLLAALGAAGLVSTLAAEGEFTVFAPTNAAFDALEAASPGILDALLADPTELLTQVLLYHVVPGEAFSGDLTDGQELPTLQVGGQTLTVSLTGGVFVNDAEVTGPDIDASNGVVHVIDGVLVPEDETSIWEVVEGSDVHNTLEAALLAAGLDVPLNSFNVNLTLFAPTDDAFAALGTAVDDLLLDPTGALANVLLYHVVGGTNLSSDLSDGLEVLTAQGETVTVTITGEDVFINGAEVIVEDIETVNGVVHVIDAVLLPTSCTQFVGGPFGNFNTAFGGAPVAADGVCPFNVITGFQGVASEAYIINNFVEGTTYTFGLSGGDLGAWDASFVIQNATSGAVVASEEGSSITWTSPEDGNYIIIIQETGFCGGQSENTAVNNGFPYITCESTATVVDIIVGSEIHTTLETAVIAAGLDGALSGEGPFTVFAPTDEAFDAVEAAAPGTLAALLADPSGALTQILQHHVVAGLAYSTDLSDGQNITTLLGDDVTVGIDGGVVTITSSTGNSAEVTVANISASNGVVHVIDAVLIPAVVNAENIESVASLGVYPNPTNNQFTIDLDMLESDNVTIDLINVIGQSVKSVNLGTRSVGMNRTYMDVNDIPAGFYIMNITVGGSQVSTKVQIAR
jgi:uncharacterized surface protein with fasciclin (FAS1) repeats